MSYRVAEEEAATSNFVETDDTPFRTTMYSSMDYSDYLVQNQLIPPVFASASSLQDELINFTNEQSFAAGAPAYPFDCPTNNVESNSCLGNCPVDTTDYCCGALPLDSGFNNFMAAAQHHTEKYEWILGEQSINSGNYNSELGLSLSAQEQCSEISSSSHSFRKPKVGYDHTSSSTNAMNNPSKPLQLSCSAFMHAMQKILAEIASFSLEDPELQSKFSVEENAANPSSSALASNTMEVEAKKKHLLALLQLVDSQYSRCLDEVHTVISAFHAVTDLDPNLHARFALPAISNMYKKLRERISNHILELGSRQIERQGEEINYSSLGASSSSRLQKQWAREQMKKGDQHLWKPQRGLPERSVSVLKAWMFQNFLHPYPKDADKHLLALRSGLTRSQVSNWFINARVRLWKPMIEEMYAEMNTRKPRRSNDETDGVGKRIPTHFAI